ncbi:hypothetical protein [Dyadobacter sp. NIV53]|uniref:hypothetical protein n=1 Tax=Dyadobacter sp. NIV53 TaxID=2861765 RepID=UPI001C86F528|nr:hypothetical protein [Dyadobacter sp. NIV53]
MNKTPIVLLQQRDFGQKMNASFEFATRNFGPLVKALIFIAGPSALLSGIAQGMFQSRTLPLLQNGDVFSRFGIYLTTEYLFVAIFSLVTYFLAYATVSAFIILYEEKGSSNDIQPGLVWNKIIENISVSIGAQVLSFILILIGTMFFVIPGIYLGVCFQFFMMITIREKLSVTDSLKRSYNLIQGKWWSTFGLIIIMSIVSSIVAIVFQFPVMVTTIMNALGLGKGITDSKVLIIAASIIATVGKTVVEGIVWIAVAFQYYNLLERSEGSGLRAEIETLGSGDSGRPDDEDRF